MREGRRTYEDAPDVRLARLLVRQPALVCLEAREADGHLGHDAREDGTEPLVQGKRGLPLDDQGARGDESSGLCLIPWPSRSAACGADITVRAPREPCLILTTAYGL